MFLLVTGIGDECLGYNEIEQMDELKEAIRNASALGCKTMQNLFMKTINVESFGNAESAAEGAAMGVWVYQEFKAPDKHITVPKINLYNDCDYTGEFSKKESLIINIIYSNMIF